MSLMTEEQAKRKRCPMTSVKWGRCCASECMAWRWGKAPIIRREKLAHPDSLSSRELEEILAAADAKHIESFINDVRANFFAAERPDNVPDNYERWFEDVEWFGFGDKAPYGWIEPESEARARAEKKRAGYCGLAGKLGVA
ncbi:hypothetical protein JCM16814_08080 [Desulfobaculum senezii]